MFFHMFLNVAKLLNLLGFEPREYARSVSLEKNPVECTSQRVKRTSGARVVIFSLKLCFVVVFEPREYARTISFEKCCRLH